MRGVSEFTIETKNTTCSSGEHENLTEHQAIATAWLAAAKTAPQFIWTVIGLTRDRARSHEDAMTNARFATIVRLVRA